MRRSKVISKNHSLPLKSLKTLEILGRILIGILIPLSTYAASYPSNALLNAFPRAVPETFKNWGLGNSATQSDIQATYAWKIEEGKKAIVVAVIDTGIDPNHKALAVNLWHPQGTQNLPPFSQLSNKPISAIYGWNFVSNQPNPEDDHGHGTHVAGIIGAVADPLNGISGVAHHVSLMPIKYYSEGNTGAVNLINTIKAIKFAVHNGARIINYSGGGPEYSQEEFLALKEAEAKGILVIAAAGNERQNTDEVSAYYYPSAYQQYKLTNIISVAATDKQNRILSSSNWGSKSVDIAAPGEGIYSTLPRGRYGYMTGTSQATAFVTGVAALLLSQNPRLQPKQLKEIIMKSADRFPQLQGRLVSGGRVNAYKALQLLRSNFIPAEVKLASQAPESIQSLLVKSGP